ncbi:uncharacterized protein B0P05DRAFT_579420 [Gilbertella persicaria]|uniref:uncharacterized protein n=1 Tax=Gilbertella persicaria TaxID=101096 RepID=UPI0022209F88|nr:uncharacterized protein B0P05DRAFT_579420 [Gilbertella persicaria]KAI8079105.1 hypothetical protein B0P05DRAFT_579420 [Gilbertella persicaria]
MFVDGSCLQINMLNNSGWKTENSDDWVYYPQQYVNVSMTAAKVSVALVGGCCAPNRFKQTGFLYQDDGSTYAETGNKIVSIADRGLKQNITVTGWYMKKFVDDNAMNLTIIPSIHHPDKQSIFFEIVAFDRAMMINYQFFDYQDKLIGSHSSGVLRNAISIPDITLPRYTRRVSLYSYALNSLLSFMVQEQILCAFLIFTLVSIPIRFLCRTPSHKVLMCIIITLGSFILNQAWNLINSQSSIFHDWLPRAAKIVGAFTTCVLFGLRISLDLPSLVITYARSLPFLIVNSFAAVPTFIAYFTVLVYFGNDHNSTFGLVWLILTVKIWQVEFFPLVKYVTRPEFMMMCIRKLFGVHKHVRIPFAIKTSLTLLLYCLVQLIPLLLTQMIGVGGIVPLHICSWTPYLAQFQYHPNPMEFAIKTFLLIQIAVYFATLGAGGWFTGTLYFMVEVSLIGVFITAIIQLDRLRDLFFRHVGYGVFFASFFIAFIVQLIQKRITNLIFIENRSRFTIQNRAPLLHYWYFMMLTSMTRALTSYIIRTLKLILRYPLFSLRVDRNAETWSVRRGDGGFTAYCGMLLAEHEYNNPVVLVFVECLLHCTSYLDQKQYSTKSNIRLCKKHQQYFSKRHAKEDEEEIFEITALKEDMILNKHALIDDAITSASQEMTSAPTKVLQRAKTRWFLAYTLIHNPGMRQYRMKRLIT